MSQGRKQGRGKYTWRGAVYEGEFAKDCIQGQGTFKIGKTNFRGMFSPEIGERYGPEMKGVIVYDNGDQFDGVVAVR